MVTYVEMKTGLLCESTFEAALHEVPGIWGPRRGPGLLTSLFFDVCGNGVEYAEAHQNVTLPLGFL